uniref:Uncharacterized protein n=1 Tax=Ditylenchus dipsaci TaxID=166011 RepID=A0A915CVX0_9BILA
MSSTPSIFNFFKKNVHKSECRIQPEMHTPNESEDRRISMTSTNSLPVDMSSSKKKLCQRRSSMHISQIKGLSCCVEEENIETHMWGDSPGQSSTSSGYSSATTFRARSWTTSSTASTQQYSNSPNSVPTASEPNFVGGHWEDVLHARGNTQAYLLSLVAPTKRILIHDPLRNKVSVYSDWSNNPAQDGSYPNSI